MNQKWINSLNSLPLSKKEYEAVNLFFQKGRGGYLLPVVDILNNYELKEEGLSLLKWGVSKHQGFHAKVRLADSLYWKGEILEAKKILNSLENFKQNLTAQKLIFWIAVLDEYKFLAENMFRSLIRSPYKGKELQSNLNHFKVHGLHSLKSELVRGFKELGITISVPGIGPSNKLIDHVNLQPNKDAKTRSTDQLLKQIEQTSSQNCYLLENSAIFHAVESPSCLGTFAKAYTYESYKAIDKSLEVYKTLTRPEAKKDSFLAKKISRLSDLNKGQLDDKTNKIRKKISRSLIPDYHKNKQLDCMKFLLDRCYEKESSKALSSQSAP